ncbi:MAG: addiction module antitoxin [Rhodospirillaceae bacterium BRH_c57]|nr:MAG: addiction module antitoxin [Rhodospirillaceae bacterium BRH_c57]
MATMKVSLPDSVNAWVETQAESGQYCNACDYARDLIRKDQERCKAIATVQAAITEGFESGDPQPLNAAAFKLRMRERYVVR